MALITNIAKLHQKKYRYEFSEFLVEGIKGVAEALQFAEVKTLIVDINKETETAIVDLVYQAGEKNVDILTVGQKEFNKIKTTDTFPGIMAVVAMPASSFADISGPVVCVDGISDPGNLGTIIRTADWFGVDHILLSPTCVDPYNEKVVRSSMGSLFHVQIHQSSDLLEDLENLKQQKHYTVVGLSLDGEPLTTFLHNDRRCYVFGSESHGMSPELEKILDARYTISGKGKAESLNVAIAAGIVLSRLS